MPLFKKTSALPKTPAHVHLQERKCNITQEERMWRSQSIFGIFFLQLLYATEHQVTIFNTTESISKPSLCLNRITEQVSHLNLLKAPENRRWSFVVVKSA